MHAPTHASKMLEELSKTGMRQKATKKKKKDPNKVQTKSTQLSRKKQNPHSLPFFFFSCRCMYLGRWTIEALFCIFFIMCIYNIYTYIWVKCSIYIYTLPTFFLLLFAFFIMTGVRRFFFLNLLWILTVNSPRHLTASDGINIHVKTHTKKKKKKRKHTFPQRLPFRQTASDIKCTGQKIFPPTLRCMHPAQSSD